MNLSPNKLTRKFTEKELPEIAGEILEKTKPGIFLFYGKMGTGKTTLIKELCSRLQVTDTTSSPTFSIINEYSSPKGIIYHLDLYRIENQEEILNLGLEEYLEHGYYVFIEWPEKMEFLLSENFYKIFLKTEPDTNRTLTLHT